MNCYITYLCNDNYLPGIVALVKSLKYHKTKNQILVMVTKDVSSECTKNISNLGVIVKTVNEIHYQGKRKDLIRDRFGRENNSWMIYVPDTNAILTEQLYSLRKLQFVLTIKLFFSVTIAVVKDLDNFY